MSAMFSNSSFNSDISTWDTSSVTQTMYMFAYSTFKQDLSNWNIKKVCILEGMFDSCPAPVPYWAQYKDIHQRQKAIEQYQTILQHQRQLQNIVPRTPDALKNFKL